MESHLNRFSRQATLMDVKHASAMAPLAPVVPSKFVVRIIETLSPSGCSMPLPKFQPTPGSASTSPPALVARVRGETVGSSRSHGGSCLELDPGTSQLLTKFQINLGLHTFTPFANTKNHEMSSFVPIPPDLEQPVHAGGSIGAPWLHLVTARPLAETESHSPGCATLLCHRTVTLLHVPPLAGTRQQHEHPRNSIAQMHSYPNMKQLHIVSCRSTFGLTAYRLTDSARASFWPWLRAHFCRPSWLLCLSQSKTL